MEFSSSFLVLISGRWSAMISLCRIFDTGQVLILQVLKLNSICLDIWQSVWKMSTVFNGDEIAPFFGFIGAAAALVFSCMNLFRSLSCTDLVVYVFYLGASSDYEISSVSVCSSKPRPIDLFFLSSSTCRKSISSICFPSSIQYSVSSLSVMTVCLIKETEIPTKNFAILQWSWSVINAQTTFL